MTGTPSAALPAFEAALSRGDSTNPDGTCANWSALRPIMRRNQGSTSTIERFMANQPYAAATIFLAIGALIGAVVLPGLGR